MSIRKVGWARIEGAEIQDLYKEYGTFSHLPNEQQHVYYGAPEIQLENPFSTVHSAVYKKVSIEHYFQLDQINLIDQYWGTGGNLDLKKNIENALAGVDTGHYANIDINDQYTDFYVVGKPFVVTESSVIFYASSDMVNVSGARYDNYFIVLIDEHATPRVVNIEAKYEGAAVPVNTTFDEEQLKVYTVYDDGNKVKIDTGYTIEPANKLVLNLGENPFEISYIDAEYEVNTVTIIIEGCRNLQGIRAEWEGTQVAYGKPADTKFITVIAYYSDEFEQTVTDYTFPNGNIVSKTNEGNIDIYYQGKECTVTVPTFEVKKQRIIAYYNGPKVEINHNYLKQYVNVKAYYQSADEIGKSYYEDIDIEECLFEENTLVTEEGNNSFSLTYEGILGVETTTFSVIGFSPIVIARALEATYTGPSVLVGKSIKKESIICNIHWSDGSTTPTNQFSMSTNIIQEVGNNEITISYTDGRQNTVKDVLVVTGLDIEQTTENNLFPTELTNNYPKATILNNRYRGPAEGVKMNNVARDIISNIKELYEIFTLLEKQYNDIISYVEGQESLKILTLNDVKHMDNQIYYLLNDNHYSTGTYKSEDIVE